MASPLNNYFADHQEPNRSCLQFLREMILDFDPGITERWSYQMPFYHYNGGRICYLWTEKRSGKPYIGFVDGKHLHHPLLVTGNRSKMKILPIEPGEDIPVKLIRQLLMDTVALHKAPGK